MWHRTSKFKALPDSLQALHSVRGELLLVFALMVAGLLLLPYASFQPPDVLLLASVGFIASSLANLAAPMMAILAELKLRDAPLHER